MMLNKNLYCRMSLWRMSYWPSSPSTHSWASLYRVLRRDFTPPISRNRTWRTSSTDNVSRRGVARQEGGGVVAWWSCFITKFSSKSMVSYSWEAYDRYEPCSVISALSKKLRFFFLILKRKLSLNTVSDNIKWIFFLLE